ncbi:MAG: 4-hydroxythreonine-4-phosphate dehydrogenase PdxA, partial [Bacteroidaceae bacterium]|nr:4-hydroxythreonine-4-phosphate dehydrogenase PdxA [Bacteroidaceae bacterium]
MRQAPAPVAAGEPPVLPPADDDELPPPPPFEGEAPRPVTPPLPRNEALIMLMNSQMRIALVTSHLPLREVANAITQESLVRKLRAFDHSLRRDFTITRPRIAVLGLNPHAGDNGNLGSEEQTVIRPAIEEATRMGVHAHGPYAADSFFGTRAYEHFDGVLAMYHDQGLASFKALAMENGINFTAGLDVVRTAPDLGVSYDIAGKG